MQIIIHEQKFIFGLNECWYSSDGKMDCYKQKKIKKHVFIDSHLFIMGYKYLLSPKHIIMVTKSSRKIER